MKRLLIVGLLIIALITTGCGVFSLNGWLLPDDMEFLEVVESLDTPEKISYYMENNFTYEPNLYGSKSPYELWQVREGDCNDFACFGTFVADYNGYETWQILIYFKTTGYTHYLGVYNEGRYSFTDNKDYYYGFDTFREIVDESGKHTGQEWKSYKVYDYEMNIIEIREF